MSLLAQLKILVVDDRADTAKTLNTVIQTKNTIAVWAAATPAINRPQNARMLRIRKP